MRADQGHDNLFPYIALDAIAMPGEEGASHLREMVEKHGARGVKLHGPAQGFNMSDERMWPAYSACQEMGIPIVAHSGPDKLGAGYAEPRAFAGMLAAFPDLKVVIAHMGGGTWGQARELAEAYSNAYFDCCEIIEWVGGATNAPGEEEFAQLIWDIGASRVLMGSDFPWYDRPYHRAGHGPAVLSRGEGGDAGGLRAGHLALPLAKVVSPVTRRRRGSLGAYAESQALVFVTHSILSRPNPMDV